ncbi:membrane protein insertase YidC [Nonomuraea sp. NEAU-A123]|uniref:YidC/Oxa1 family membrane protein insertase n=1 Tax=Nonomuraea sp. NEAU-A123 TaxID=2839649 RepID=UPI001BE49AF1|nr:membrane protein insertase YidC [Nonomuraea sp. NEAU-A123]MBT2226530.1 membrane protein insertase YidC [Nonomuraea sp. NEAU-A123]
MFDSLVSFLLTVSGDNAAVAIMLFTVAVRLLLLPLGIRQARATQIQKRLAPKLREVQKRWSRNPERLAKETSKLYAKEGTSPLASILPGLGQLPFMWVMYRVATHPTAFLGHNLLGAPLGQHVAGIVTNYGLVSVPFMVFAVVIALIAVVAWFSARKVSATLPEEQPALMRRLMPLMPFGSVLAAAVLPLAAGLYLLISTAWVAGERAILAARPL